MATEDIMNMALLSRALGSGSTKSNIASLFGLDPNIIAQQQAQQALQGSQQTAMQYAQLSPMQQAQYAIFQGGAGATGGLLSAVGPESAQVTRAKQINAFKQILADNKITMDTPEGIKAAAALAAQNGLPEIAAELANTSMTMAKTQADITKSLQPGTESERNRAFLVGIDTALSQGKQVAPEALRQAALIVQAELKPKSYFQDGQLVTVRGESPLPQLPALSQVLSGGKFVQQAPQTQLPTGVQPTIPQGQGVTQQVAPGITATPVLPQKLDAGTIKELGAIDADIVKIDDSIKNIGEVKSTINNLDLGLLQNTGRNIQSFLGINTKDRLAFDKAQRTVQQQANNLLLLAKGVQTEGDAKRAYDTIMNPDTWKNADALQAAFNDLETTITATKDALAVKRNTLQSGGKTEAPKATNRPKAAREDAFAKLKAANPNKSDAVLNNWLDKQGY